MLNHPLPVGTTVNANRKTCNCAGGKFVAVRGKIMKVITNPTGTWYYLDIGHTIQAAWVVSVV